MNNSRQSGLTRLEIGVIIVIAVILCALLLAPGQSAADGSFDLRVTMDAPFDDGVEIRFAEIDRQRLHHEITNNDIEQFDWYPLSELPIPITIRVDYSIYSRFNVFVNRSKMVCPDGILVEYRASNESPRFRVIPFERAIGREQPAQVTIPCEPPSEAEAWTPILKIDGDKQ